MIKSINEQQNQAKDIFCHVFADRSWLAIVAMPTQLCSRMRAATIQRWLLFLSQSSICSYYSKVATNRGAASIQMNTIC